MSRPLLTPGVIAQAHVRPMTTAEIVVLSGGNPGRQARQAARELRDAGFETRLMRRLYHAHPQKLWFPLDESRRRAGSVPEGAQFAEAMRHLKVALPARLDTDHTGCIVDQDDHQLLVVDQDSERPDAEVDQLAALIVVAINQAAGLA